MIWRLSHGREGLVAGENLMLRTRRRSWRLQSLPNAGAGTMSATTRVPSTYSWRTSASTPNLTLTTTGNNRFRHI